MGQLHISIPNIAKPDFFRRNSGSGSEKGFKAHFPSQDADESTLSDCHNHNSQTVEKHAPRTQCNTIELRLVQDGKIYRSKAEEERLVALGQWHHRRKRRRERMRR